MQRSGPASPDLFAQFISDGNDPGLDLPRTFVEQLQSFMALSSQLKTSEPATNPELLQQLSTLLRITIRKVSKTHPDGISMFGTTTLFGSTLILIAELKGVFGESGCDPSVQAGYSMKQMWIQNDASSTSHSHIMAISHDFSDLKYVTDAVVQPLSLQVAARGCVFSELCLRTKSLSKHLRT